MADSGNGRIQSFTAEGEFVESIEWRGHYPLAIAVGMQEIYVTDGKKVGYQGALRQKIEKFCYVTVFFGENYEKVSRLFVDIEYSCGLALDEGGLLCVCDSGTNRIALF